MENNKYKNKGQAFSTDILVVVVVILFGTIFLVLNSIDQAQDEDLQQRSQQAAIESRIIVDELKVMGIVDTDNRVDANKLLTLNKDELKRKLDLENDFAIVFEKDGKLVKIDSQNNINCIGSDSIRINGVECS